MQNAKDTFYEVLKARVAAINPYRTIVLRGVQRPAVLVVENELLADAVLPDCFRLSWSEAQLDASGALPMVTLQCSIQYETAGTPVNGGMDRGRALAAMDGELLAAVNQAPRTATKTNYAPLANSQPAVAMATNIWWSEPVFGETVVKENRIARTTTVTVMAYQEDGEL